VAAPRARTQRTLSRPTIRTPGTPPHAPPHPPTQATLTLGFLCATLLIGLHGKHQVLDQAVHFLLMLSMAAATAASAAEAMHPHSFAVAAARPMALLLVGSWFIEIGHILYGGAQRGPWGVRGNQGCGAWQ
jgi:hypothetical protein